MLTIRKDQLAVFREQRVKRFEGIKLSDLASRFPSWYARMGEARAQSMIRAGIGKARGFGITGSNDLSTFLDLMVRYGEEFDTLESMAWYFGSDTRAGGKSTLSYAIAGGADCC